MKISNGLAGDPHGISSMDDAAQIALLKTILDSSIDYSIIAPDLKGTIVAWNAGAARLYGYAAEEVLGRSSESILQSPGAPRSGGHGAMLAAALKDGRWTGRVRRMRKDGTYFVTHVTLSLRLAASGEPAGFTMISRSLTAPELAAWELKNSELSNLNLTDELQESREMFRALTEAAHQVFFVVSADYQRMHYVSPSYADIWGVPVESLYARPQSWLDSVHPDDRERVRAELERLGDGHLDTQYRIVRRDGSTRWILARTERLRGPAGRTRRLCGLAMDITKLKEAQNDVAESEEKYRRLFESAKDGILILDANTGAIVEINPFLLELLGHTAGECYGKKLWDIGLFKDVAVSKKLFKDLQETGYVRYDDVPLKTKKGRAVQVEFVSNLYTAGGAPVIQCNIRDITQKLQLESRFRQSQKMEGIGRLAGGIAHDFNNLLTSILGYSELLLQAMEESDPKRADVLEIKKSGNRAAGLTRQLLAFSRQQVLELSVIDINVSISELDKMLRRIIGEDISFEFVPGAALSRIKAAPGQIDQIIMNLCINAKDAMASGGRLRVETSNLTLGEDGPASHLHLKAGDYVQLTITDTGCGMSADVLSHLYEPFFTTKEQGRGTGLGLSTVYGIIQQSGGSIEVVSEVGKGTTFKMYFPAVTEPLAPPSGTPAPGATCRGSETVLLVEDDEPVRKFLARVLKMYGYDVLAASAPEEAVSICADESRRIDLMLTDVVMPNMTGFELCRRVTPRRPKMKVIYMSGYTEQSIIQKAMLNGASFLQKPMSTEAVVRQVRCVLDAAPAP